MTKLVAYLRVSTDRQGRSGLGLEAQRAAVGQYAAAAGAAIVREFVEVESGRRCDRPELAKAIGFAKRSKATLCVAKLDRLARNVAFLAALMDGKEVPFVACDNPHANRFTLHVLAAVAEQESAAISDRTKAALAARRARGLPLGAQIVACGRNLTPEQAAAGRRKGAQAIAAAFRRDYAELAPSLVRRRQEGETLQAIADALNASGEITRTGKPWAPSLVQRILRAYWPAGRPWQSEAIRTVK